MSRQDAGCNCCWCIKNFPGQFRQLAPHLESRGHDLVAICGHQRPIALKGRSCGIANPKASGVPLRYTTLARRSSAFCCCCQVGPEPGCRGWKPDQILGHSGWGKPWALSAIWPDVPQIIWPELWIRPEHGGYGIDPKAPDHARKVSSSSLAVMQ